MKTHLAGIIPIANIKTDHDNLLPEILLPIDNGFSAIQKSVYECALAGCNTIWIVANDDMAPIVRKCVGDWVYDPVYYNRNFSKFHSERRKEIPIYYVPIHPKDRERRDSYGWSVINGIYNSWTVSNKLSKWLNPTKYYVSFPLGAFNLDIIRKSRNLINDKQNNFFLSLSGKTVKDDLLLSFTMFGEDFKLCRRHVNKTTTREFLPPLKENEMPTEKLPFEERWSARYFQLSDVFYPLQIQEKTVDVDWYYDLSIWQNYCEFLGSDKFIKKPIKELTKPHLHVKIPYIVEEGEE
tara:strand:- start:614 stop:1498 length:885 start_codon:yes stop_codon:yes gene_type:complete